MAGPHPLDYLPDPWNTNTYWKGTDGINSTNAPAYRDRKLQIWAKRAGTNGAAATLEMHNFYPMQEGFFFPSLPLTNQPALQTPVPWLCRLTLATADPLERHGRGQFPGWWRGRRAEHAVLLRGAGWLRRRGRRGMERLHRGRRPGRGRRRRL